jgi:hypothetical protein
MKRGPKGRDAILNGSEDDLVKSTYKLPRVLKLNLQAVALLEGKDQADLVREALDDFMRRKDVDPTRPPRILTHRAPTP